MSRGRPQLPASKRKSWSLRLRLDDEDLRRLQRLSHRRRESAAAVIRAALVMLEHSAGGG